MTDAEIGSLETEMNRGFLHILVLALLEKNTYGYAMAKHIEGLGYRVEENTLYPLLRRLEKNGWIKSHWEMGEERPRKIYAITAAGRALRASLVEIWNNQNRILKEINKENADVRNASSKPISKRSDISCRAARNGRRSCPRSGATSWKKPRVSPAARPTRRSTRSSPPTARPGGWPRNTSTAGRSSPRSTGVISSAIRPSSSPTTRS